MDGTVGSDRSVFIQERSREWMYCIEPEKLHHPDLGEYSTYGIRIVSSDDMEILHDVSVCENSVNYIVKMINQYHLSPIHLYDVVVDMLS